MHDTALGAPGAIKQPDRLPPAGTTRDLADEAQQQIYAADTLTTVELEKLIGFADRNYGPLFLEVACSEAKVTSNTVADLVGRVWAMAEFPDRQLDHDTWRWLFDVAGYTVDGQRQSRPSEPVLLYRGSVPERRTDWSWTTNVDVAAKYASGTMRGRLTGRLWTCLVPPDRLLAKNTIRDEDEIVVDTRGLHIKALA